MNINSINTIKPEFKSNPNFYSSESKLLSNTIENEKVKWQNKEELTKNINAQTSAIRISVFDVAAYILKKLGQMSSMKLHKLLYYCQAWSLVWDEAPLFFENIEAWSNGPVIRELFNFHRGHFQVEKIENGNPDKLSPTQKETIDSVLNYYGNRQAQWLIDLTHNEEPWLISREGLSPTDRGNNIITLESMAEYYSSL